MNQIYEKLTNCYQCIREMTDFEPKVAIVLGSGLGDYANQIEIVSEISYDKIDKPIRVKARVRYNQREQDATVEQIDENTLHIVFDVLQRAISKGQAVVLYDGDYVVGGGTII